MDELKKFLKKRGQTEEEFQKMAENKIDHEVIPLMTEDELKIYVPAYGDRVAVVAFCKRLNDEGSVSLRKYQIINKLRQKLGIRKEQAHNDSDDEDQYPKMERFGNKNARKSLRTVEIGWLHKDSAAQTYKQVRKATGGGTRKMPVEKNSNKKDILKYAIGLFFPEGQSPRGSLEDFDVSVNIFENTPMDPDETVEQIFERMKLPILRFYMVTILKASPTSPVTSERITSQQKTRTPGSPVRELVETDTVSPGSQPSDLPVIQLRHKRTDTSKTTEAPVFDVDLREETMLTDDEVIAGMAMAGASEFQTDFLTTIEENDHASPSENKSECLIIRRGYAFEDLIEAFTVDRSLGKAPLQIQRLLPNGELEQADDFGGVLRDLLSEFWESFYSKCTLGTQMKVPFLRHDFGHDKWDVIGRILKAGFEHCRYFPVLLAPTFVQQMVDGSVVRRSADKALVRDYLQFLGESERSVVQQAIDDFENVDADDLLEVMNDHKARRIPAKGTILQIVAELAEKELIQEPMFVIDIWSVHMKSLNLGTADIDEIYEHARPTPKRIIRMLEFAEGLTEAQKEVTKYLTKYLKELEPKVLRLFLRFVTGADVICTEKIRVAFSTDSGFSARPIAHTCSGLLELPSDYKNFPDFRDQFTEVLHSGVWVMEFV